jgi:hypothetical protein
MVRYYGFYSNVPRGIRQKENQETWFPILSMENSPSGTEVREGGRGGAQLKISIRPYDLWMDIIHGK